MELPAWVQATAALIQAGVAIALYRITKRYVLYLAERDLRPRPTGLQQDATRIAARYAGLREVEFQGFSGDPAGPACEPPRIAQG